MVADPGGGKGLRVSDAPEISGGVRVALGAPGHAVRHRHCVLDVGEGAVEDPEVAVKARPSRALTTSSTLASLKNQK